jgi:hypothetical protein
VGLVIEFADHHGDGVARGEGDDVGAGDDAGALVLELRLGGVDHVLAAQALVLAVVHLGVVARAPYQHRRVAPLPHYSPARGVASERTPKG